MNYSCCMCRGKIDAASLAHVEVPTRDGCIRWDRETTEGRLALMDYCLRMEADEEVETT